MTNIYIFTQNLILESLKKYQSLSSDDDVNVFVTTHFLFENEKEFISSLFSHSIFKCFADFLTDEEMGMCDTKSYLSDTIDYDEYISGIKKEKNRLIVSKVFNEFSPNRKFIFSDDLGIDADVWKKHGFKYLRGEYYYSESKKRKIRSYLAKNTTIRKIYKKISGNPKKAPEYSIEEVSVAHYNGKKYVFIGNMNRIGYRLDISFKSSVEECEKLNRGEFERKETCTYMTTWHEHNKCQIPDDDCYAVRWAQDGYLPPNYTHKDYFFKPRNVVYYCWDVLGTSLFKNQGLPYEMIPFRKKLYIPTPVFPKEVKSILVVASGSGDWTALKNRSDDDIMVYAFAQMAKKYPQIHFTYRCHPTWIHPLNVGVNAINRVHDYFSWLNLPNLSLSSNIPLANADGYFQYSFSRSSLEEDLKNADLVFGEHSISMIDAAFKGIPFCSVNLTRRRNFFVGINQLGFPSVSTHDGIAEIIQTVTTKEFKDKYVMAIKNYNQMTNMDNDCLG